MVKTVSPFPVFGAQPQPDPPLDDKRASPHFTFAELSRSDTATRKRLDNTPPRLVRERLRVTCAVLMEPIRELFDGRLVLVTSGYRSDAVTVAVGSAAGGPHTRGEAIDFEIPGVDNLEVARSIADSGLPFDQLILEGYDGVNPSSGWIHIAHRQDGKPQRGEVWTATAKAGGGWRYSKGLPA